MKWPADTREGQKLHALRHVQSLEVAIRLCGQKRTAVQAGGNVGLWPLRLAKDFARVLTFEPEPLTFMCLAANMAALANVEARPEALGACCGHCGIERRSLGSHRITPGNAVKVIPLDHLGLEDVDLIQLDVEGFELPALQGAAATIARCQPVIMVEMLEDSDNQAVTDFLAVHGYRETRQASGRDFVFTHG